MSSWIKIVAVALAAAVGFVHAFAQLNYTQAAHASAVLSVGDELEEEDLLEVEGEFWHWIVAAAAGVLWAIGWTIYDAFFDGEPGFQHTRTIIGGALMVYCGFFIVGGMGSQIWDVLH